MEVDRRYSIARREPDELILPTEKERIGANRQSCARLGRARGLVLREFWVRVMSEEKDMPNVYVEARSTARE